MSVANYPTLYISCVDGKPYAQVGLKISEKQYEAICRYNDSKPEFLQLSTTHQFDVIEKRRRHMFIMTFYPKIEDSIHNIWEQSLTVMEKAVRTREWKEAMQS